MIGKLTPSALVSDWTLLWGISGNHLNGNFLLEYPNAHQSQPNRKRKSFTVFWIHSKRIWVGVWRLRVVAIPLYSKNIRTTCDSSRRRARLESPISACAHTATSVRTQHTRRRQKRQTITTFVPNIWPYSELIRICQTKCPDLLYRRSSFALSWFQDAQRTNW